MSGAVDVLAHFDAEIASSRALSADAFHADRVPKLEATRAALAKLIAAAHKCVRECPTCGGHGLVDTSSGQTPDNYQPDAMDCPECTDLGSALARIGVA